LFIIAGCIVSPPTIRLTGEKTAVENQVIGEYREIEPDAWSVSSAKTGVQRQKGSSTSAGDDIIFGALKIRELNENRIRSYKNEGSLGEALTGYIVYRQSEKYEKDADLKKNLVTLVLEENKARKVIFERSAILAGKEKPSESDLIPLTESFAADQKERAKKNDWIQESDGTWIRKK
jgi:uncharacterized protein YdbL (DUF1318 family)